MSSKGIKTNHLMVINIIGSNAENNSIERQITYKDHIFQSAPVCSRVLSRVLWSAPECASVLDF